MAGTSQLATKGPFRVSERRGPTLPYVQCPSCRLPSYSAAVGYLDVGLCPQCGDPLPLRARVIPISRHPRFMQDDAVEEALTDDSASI